LKSYTVASEEGAQRYGAEVGAQVELELGEDEERAVVAAGWLDQAKTKEAK
jgi:hypothetical protein